MPILLYQINETWRPHNRRDDDDPGACMAVGIDDRYLMSEDCGEMRMMATFGPNPHFHREKGGFVPPPSLPTEYVFGLHLVGVVGDEVTVYDEWFDALPAASQGDAARLPDVLAAMPDERVVPILSCSDTKGQPLLRRPLGDVTRYTLGEGG